MTMAGTVIKPGWCVSPWSGERWLLHDWPLIERWLSRCEESLKAGCGLVPWSIFAPGGDDMPFEAEPEHFIENSRGQKFFRGLLVLIGRNDVGLVTGVCKYDPDHPCHKSYQPRASICRSHWDKDGHLHVDGMTPLSVPAQRNLFA